MSGFQSPYFSEVSVGDRSNYFGWTSSSRRDANNESGNDSLSLTDVGDEDAANYDAFERWRRDANLRDRRDDTEENARVDIPRPRPPPPLPQPTSQIAQTAAPRPKATGFVDKNGNHRAYDAPPPPAIGDIKWDRIGARMNAWALHASHKAPYDRMDVDAEPLVLIANDGVESGPDPDFYSSKNVRRAIEEAEDLLRPISLIRDAAGDPGRWSEDVERELESRGIKLADSNVIDISVDGESRKLSLGVRFFHLSYRYFVAVLLGGDMENYKTEFPVDGRPCVAYYYVALTVEEARVQQCP